jgi:hypothetical protein
VEAICDVDDAGAVGLAHSSVPGCVARILQQDSFDVSQGNFVPPQPKSMQGVPTAFEQSVRDAEQCLQSMTDDRAGELAFTAG